LIYPHACALYANILKRAVTSTLSVERCQVSTIDGRHIRGDNSFRHVLFIWYNCYWPWLQRLFYH
jgi:hypothetical protein